MLLSTKTAEVLKKKTYRKIRHLYMFQSSFKYKQTNCMTVTYLRNSILPREVMNGRNGFFFLITQYSFCRRWITHMKLNCSC